MIATLGEWLGWLLNESLLYLILFGWGYLFARCLKGGLWGKVFALFLGWAYWDIIALHKSYLADGLFILGAVYVWFDFKTKLREYGSYGLAMGKYTVMQKLHHLWFTLTTPKEKLDDDQSNDQGSHHNSYFDEELHRERQRRERAEEQQRYYQEQANRAREEQQAEQEKQLNPKVLADAYAILGVEYGTSKEECKKAYRKLMAMYHPDKLAGFTGWRKEQMEAESKLITVAWGTINPRENQ